MLSGVVLIAAALLLCFNDALALEPMDWWESATFYQIYPRSFMDSNNDGVGDLNGITFRLRHLKDIGVTAAWLSPIFESPMIDAGYAVSNFTNIDPLLGTLDDFDAMIATAHKLGLKVILGFVPNHSSDECEWFKKSVRREEGYEDFYVWDDGKIDSKTGKRIPPSNWRPFVGSNSAWTWNEERQQYYLHMFFSQQPDLNLRNPKVRESLIDVMKFWLDRGVDGFRINSVQAFFETRFEDGTYPDNPPKSDIYTINLPENINLLYEWREYLDKYQQVFGGDTRVMLSESYSPIEYLSNSIGNGTLKGSQIPLNFNLSRLDRETTAQYIKNQTDEWMSVIWSKHKTANWLTGSHDAHRLATRMGQTKVDIMTMIIHALPGVSITYYGEEIGMTNGLLNSPPYYSDPERTPMQWDTSVNAGFNRGNPTWLPVNPNYHILNVETQRGTSRSSLHIFKGMVKLKQTSAFKAFKEDGGFKYGALNEQVFHIMRTDKTTEEYRLLANFNNRIEFVDGLTNKTMEYVLLNSYSLNKYGDTVDLSKRIYLMPFEAVVLRWTA